MSAVEDRIDRTAAQLDADPRIGTVWQGLLAKKGSGYAGDERNVLIALRRAPELAGLVRFNEFALTIEFARSPPWREVEAGAPWLETDDTALQSWLQSHDVPVRGRGPVADCVALAAQDRTFHPVRTYLEGLRWDREPRLQIWLQEYLNATGPGPYLAAIGPKFLISAVARIFRPGCQADHVLTLEGPQGVGKTSAARALAVELPWFAGSLPDIHTKDAALQLLGRWIIEVAELRAVRNSQAEGIKAFITETADVFRPPYGRRTAQFPRQCVFIATTNETEYLRDPTGNRRYWPVRCGRVRIEALVAGRDQLWAEAVHEFKDGALWHLTPTEAATAASEQAERVYVTELEADVAGYLADRLAAGVVETSVRDVLVYGLRLEPQDGTYAERARKLGAAVAEALERCGWRKVARTRQGDSRRTLYRHGGQGGQGGQG